MRSHIVAQLIGNAAPRQRMAPHAADQRTCATALGGSSMQSMCLHRCALPGWALCAGLLGVAWHSPLPAQTPIYRCGSSYSDAPCPAAAQPPARLQHVPPVTGPSSKQRIFLCRLGERQFWSADTCQWHNATQRYSYLVPAHWNWEQKWQHAERAWQHAARSTQRPPAVPHPADTAQRAQHQRSRPDCAQTAQRIQQLDAMARQGGPGHFMERIRTERKALRDAQFRAGC